MRYILLIKLIFLFCIKVTSQNDDINLQKYWYYKTRLNNDFIKTGTKQGESIPFNQRGSTQVGYPTITNNKQTLKTGDAISSLGLHIAALATEYHLLKSANQRTDSVKHEIFCALNAINRLDNIAEPFWSWAGGNATLLNGFLIRDDVPSYFVAKNYAHFNYYNNGYSFDINTGNANAVTQLNDRGFCSQQTIGQAFTESDYADLTKPVGASSPDTKTMSQDHYITLLVGLSLVNKLVDYGATDNGNVFPYEFQNVSSLKQEAWNIIDRITNRFKYDNLWNYVNPITSQVVSPGGNTAFTQYGIAEASCKSEGFTAYPPDPFIPLINPFGSMQPYTCGYTTPYVRTIGFGTWYPYITTGATTVDNQSFKVHLLAVGHCGWQPAPVNVASYICTNVSQNICSSAPWPLNMVCNWVTNLVCNTVYVPVAGYYNKTDNFIDVNATLPYGPLEQYKEIVPRKYDFWHASLLHKVLYPNNNSSFWAHLNPLKGALDNAPCEGPYNFGRYARPQFEWTCENRLEKVINRQDWDEPDKGWFQDKAGFKGEFNGIDYMVMHNLYRLTSPNISNANYTNLSHRYINVPFPIANVNLCAKPNNCLIRAFESITADNTINSNADVSYKAGKVIVLKPGFNVVSGADFHAYIQRAVCSSGASGLRTAVTDSTKGPENTFYGYDDMGDNIITHYVNYGNVKDSVREDLLSFLNPNNMETQEMPILPPEEINHDKINSFNVYPNPADNFSTVEFSLQEKENAQLVILNNLGQIVAADVVSDINTYRKTFYTADLAKGIYLIKIITSTNRLLIKKLTIQ